MIGFLDIVPFDAGNERLSRIIVNWALRRTGLPVCINLFDNEDERSKFNSAIELTRGNLRLVPQGDVDDSDMGIVLQYNGGLAPLVGYLLSRISRAIVDFVVLVSEKAKWSSEETNARVVRKARESAAEGFCIICFDENPNIVSSMHACLNLKECTDTSHRRCFQPCYV
jgi:hypothetical protein